MANGVGGPILKRMSNLFKDLLSIEFFNTGEGELNHEVVNVWSSVEFSIVILTSYQGHS